MSGPTNDPARDAALATLLGCSRAAGPRAVLGLGDGPLDLDTLEAALATRRRIVQGKAATSELATAAIAELEAAAAALRPSGTPEHRGATTPRPPTPSPLPPIRPRQAPAKIPLPPGPIASRPVAPGKPGATPPAGAAARPQPVRPKPTVTAAHLTPFDRLVLSILVSGGGWNARTRVLVAGLAHQNGLDAATLRRVVTGLAGFMRQQGVAGTFGEVARAGQRPAPPPTPGRLESAILRVSEGVGREFRGDTKSSFYRLVALFGLLTVFFGVVLVTALTAPSPVVRDTNLRRQEAEAILTRQQEKDARTDGLDPTHVVVPSTRPGVVRPVVFDRPPMFRGEGKPDAVVLDLAQVATALDDLSALARRLELDADRLPDVQVMRWNEIVDLLSRTWTSMPADERRRAIDGLLGVLKFADDPVVADRLLGTFQIEPEAPVRDQLDPWRRAFRGGMLGEIVVNGDLPEPVRTIARTFVRETLPGSDGRHTTGGPFVELGGRTLDATGAALVGQAGVLDLAIFENGWERWFESQAALRRPEAVQRSLVSALGLVLRTNRGLSRSGPATDLLGRLVREIDWTAGGPDPEALRDAYQSWMRDPAITSDALWVLGSVLDGPAGIGWYRPEYVIEPDADTGERIRRLADALAGWPEPQVATARGELLPVDPVLLGQLDRLGPAVRSRLRDARSTRERLEALLAAERLALATALLSADRIREAEATIGLVIGQIDSGDPGVEIPDVLSPVRRGNDGEFAFSLKEAAGDTNAQMALIKSLLSDPLSGDLGPRDAEALVQLVWRGKPAVVRETARIAVLDMYPAGPNVAVEMLDTADRASTNEGTAEFIERYTGTILPARGDAGWDEAVRSALASHAASLLDQEADGVDRIVRAIAEVVGTRAVARGSDGRASIPGEPAAAAIDATDATRRIAEGLFLAPGGDRSLEDLDRRRASLRRLAADDVRLLIAEHISELEYLAFVLEARVPVRRADLRKVVQDAAEERASSVTGVQQAVETMLRMVELDRLRMVPREDGPLGGVI
jgi:hypothetical protein